MKTNKLATKKVYNRSNVMKRAHKLFKQLTEIERTSENWSLCMRKSWHIEKNGANVETFEQVYNKFYNPILWYVKTKVKNTMDAEDITTNVFVKLHKHFDNYDVYKAQIFTWLRTIAQNTIIDFYRTDKSSNYMNVDSFVDDEGKEFFQFVASETYETENIMDNNDLKLAINNAFANLKPKYKRIAELYFLDDKQYNEIAEICNVPMGTVKGMINRCREMLKTQLQGAMSNV
jgi:RNA polymerase sigma-70 factor (ECF subfamily)